MVSRSYLFIDRWAFQRAVLEKRLSIREVAEKAGVSITRIYRISGEYVQVRPRELRDLAKVLGVGKEELLRKADG